MGSIRDLIRTTGRSWTFMVYLAGDNNLEHFAIKDLGEMKEAGSTAQVAIVAQLDGLSDRTARRFCLMATQMRVRMMISVGAIAPSTDIKKIDALLNFVH